MTLNLKHLFVDAFLLGDSGCFALFETSRAVAVALPLGAWIWRQHVTVLMRSCRTSAGYRGIC